MFWLNSSNARGAVSVYCKNVRFSNNTPVAFSSWREEMLQKLVAFSIYMAIQHRNAKVNVVTLPIA
jgi:hypothetical protein